MKRIIVSLWSAFLFLGMTVPVWAHDDAHKKTSASAAGSTHANLADGEVRKVDMDAKRITVRHGPLTNLDMPAMTMVFQVKDTAMLDK